MTSNKEFWAVYKLIVDDHPNNPSSDFQEGGAMESIGIMRREVLGNERIRVYWNSIKHIVNSNTVDLK